MSYIQASILSFSILIAGIIGVLRFAQIRDIYRPFIYLIWIGCITEIVSSYFAYVYHNNLAVGAIYRLCESLLYTSDAADERSSVDLGGRRIIKKKKTKRGVGGVEEKRRRTRGRDEKEESRGG